MNINIATIKIGERYRKEFGDIQALADSIAKEGLLQPIGVDANYTLIFGERRIKACTLLGLESIEGRVIHVDNIMEAEYAENDVRKNFSIEERIAIAKAIEVNLGERRGKQSNDQVKVDNCPPLIIPDKLAGKKTRDIVAKKAGFSSGKTYERAKKTIKNSCETLIKMLNNDEVKVSAAEQVAKFALSEQEEILERMTFSLSLKDSIEEQNHPEPEPKNSLVQQYKDKHHKPEQEVNPQPFKTKLKCGICAKDFDRANGYVLPHKGGYFDLCSFECRDTWLARQKKQEQQLGKPESSFNIKQVINLFLKVIGEIEIDYQDVTLLADDELDHQHIGNHLSASQILNASQWDNFIFYKADLLSGIKDSDIENMPGLFNFSTDKGFVMVVPIAPTQAWWRLLVDNATQVCFPDKQLIIDDVHCEDVAIFYKEGDSTPIDRFGTLFSQLGKVWKTESE